MDSSLTFLRFDPFRPCITHVLTRSCHFYYLIVWSVLAFSEIDLSQYPNLWTYGYACGSSIQVSELVMRAADVTQAPVRIQSLSHNRTRITDKFCFLVHTSNENVHSIILSAARCASGCGLVHGPSAGFSVSHLGPESDIGINRMKYAWNIMRGRHSSSLSSQQSSPFSSPRPQF